MSISGLAWVCASFLWSHADVKDEHLVAHFAVGTTPIIERVWKDMTGQAVAHLREEGVIKHRTLSESIELGLGQSLRMESVEPSIVAGARGWSISIWVCVDDADKHAVLTQSAADEEEHGWRLGLENGSGRFEIRSAGIELTGATPIVSGRWHYIVATWDGRFARLYMNGKLEAEGTAVEDVRFAAPLPLVIGMEDAPDEKATINSPLKKGTGSEQSHRLNRDFASREVPVSLFQNTVKSGLREIKVWTRPLMASEIMLVAARNKNLLDAEPNAELTFVVEPILQFGTKDSMTFVCETSRPTKIEVNYGKNALLGTKVATDKPSLISETTVTGLETFGEYFYQVAATDENGQTIQSPLRSFQTAPPPEQAWGFGVIGDTQRNPEVTKKCADGIFACRPNLVLHCGDVVDNGFAKNQWVKDLFEPCRELLAYVPMFPVIGNHEKDSHWYYDYFALPKPEHRYTFEYANAEFFMVDSNRSLKPGSEQYQWLEKELSESKATWKIAAHHHPCFSSDEDDYGNHNNGRHVGFGFGHPNAKHAIALYEKYGVDFVFNGHIHVYERTWPILEMAVNLKKGVRYVISGGGGGGLESPSPQRTWFSLHVNRAHHYCHVAVFDRTMVFKAYDVEGRLFDTFEMTKADDR